MNISIDEIVDGIVKLDKKRTLENIDRRALKLSEEGGELSEAILSITSENNSKNKLWDDVREEAVDVILMGFDIALTQMPDDKDPEEAKKEVLEVMALKFRKWSSQIENDKDII